MFSPRSKSSNSYTTNLANKTSNRLSLTGFIGPILLVIGVVVESCISAPTSLCNCYWIVDTYCIPATSLCHTRIIPLEKAIETATSLLKLSHNMSVELVALLPLMSNAPSSRHGIPLLSTSCWMAFPTIRDTTANVPMEK